MSKIIKGLALKILSHDYAMLNVEEIGDNLALGAIDLKKATIEFEDNITPAMKKEVFVHEIIEGINFHLELGLKHRQITALATIFLHVMLQNKDIFTAHIFS